ncbi:MAG: hypothetical protein H0W63_02430 [Gemmatimonadaceae bacterium]|nr:hypothetical protein [Gemmatimonadaceae bacterium]
MTTSESALTALRALRKLAFVALLAGCRGADATDPNDAFAEGVVIPGETTSLKVVVNTANRDYLLHEPSSAAASKLALPLVILLHGSGLAAADMRATTSMDSIADARRFVVAYPQGVGSPSDWNAGNCCGDPAASGTDDIAFLKAIIGAVSARLLIDAKRVYVGGFSDGARMAYRVACEMSTQIAAVAAVSGSEVTPNCAPKRVVPLIAFHGTADPSVSYTEATATPLPRAAPAAAANLPPVVKLFMATASCVSASSVLYQRTTVRYLGTGCTGDVAFYAIFGGVHAWPIRGADFDFSASPVIADFFQAHRLP